ncbi:hypothetical protein LMG28688_03328 [Paraburkholderia caffeinitolerans]|uniref:Uncharacterized protein n=1 Tax=Paraburkholderia caffeinitolerans TaxID=1723730 RepID=A0A6J5G3V0_9BURK|nr:hypothetical protein LMG28688_03328 [Paraburkholderia caffeinitolerans]
MVELREQLRFVDEALEPGAEGVLVALRAHRDIGAAGHARGERGRDVLLERHVAAQQRVPGEIDDAEAAFADQPDDLELGDARVDRQRLVGGFGRGGC